MAKRACNTCDRWQSGCTSLKPEAQAWAAPGPLAPPDPPPGPECVDYLAQRKATSRTTTPVIR